MGLEQVECLERWRPVIGYEGFYEVSDWGRARSLAHPTKTKREGVFRISPGRILIPKVSKWGYLELTLSTEIKGRSSWPVAKIAALAWVGLRPPGKQIDHKDGDKQNNCAWNLRYLTPKENINAGNYSRTWPRGETHGQAKLSDADIVEIRRLAIEGVRRKDIQSMFKISRRYLYNVLHDKNRRVKP